MKGKSVIVSMMAAGMAMFLCGVFTASAQEKVTLYGDYYYGMSVQEVTQLSEAGKCDDEDLEGCLCRASVDFAGEKWEQIFQIYKDRLVKVVFLKKDGDRTFTTLAQKMADDGYRVVYAENDDDELDMFALNAQDAGAAQSMLSKFMAQPGDAEYMFLKADAVTNITAARKVDNFVALVTNAPASLQAVEIIREDSQIMVVFSAPIALNEDTKNSPDDPDDLF